VSSDGPAAAMETDDLLPRVLGCGTVCQLIGDKLTLTLNSLSLSLTFLFRRLERGTLWLLLNAPSK